MIRATVTATALAVIGCLFLAQANPARADQAATSGVSQTIEFSGEASEKECDFIPETPFVIDAAMTDQKHTLAISCARKSHKTSSARDLRLTFMILNKQPAGHYEFRWGEDPNAPAGTINGLFTRNPDLCTDVLKTIQVRVQKLARPDIDRDPMNTPSAEATWHGKCVPEDKWGMVLVFQLDMKPDAVN